MRKGIGWEGNDFVVVRDERDSGKAKMMWVREARGSRYEGKDAVNERVEWDRVGGHKYF